MLPLFKRQVAVQRAISLPPSTRSSRDCQSFQDWKNRNNNPLPEFVPPASTPIPDGVKSTVVPLFQDWKNRNNNPSMPPLANQKRDQRHA
jgi:hypothetical protein